VERNSKWRPGCTQLLLQKGIQDWCELVAVVAMKWLVLPNIEAVYEDKRDKQFIPMSLSLDYLKDNTNFY
jgi:hypothetical protein